jgi:hypothetical protein
MSLKGQPIPHLVNGVSQQSPEVRFPTQCTEEINGYNSIIEGLKKRPPTNYLAYLFNNIGENPFVHIINRDDNEKYLVIIHNEDTYSSGSSTGTLLKVFDLTTGLPKVLVAIDGLDYIQTDNPREDLLALTYADYTFIANKKIKPTMIPVSSGSINESALIFVRQGDYSTVYKLVVTYEGTEYTISKTTNDSAITDIRTTGIALELYNALVSALGVTDWEFSINGSVVSMVNTAGNSFKIVASDSNGNNNLYCFKGQADDINDLPTVAPNGQYLKIIGDPAREEDDWYVQFETQDGEDFGQGSWVETRQDGIEYALEPANMPFLLIRTEAGNFEFKEGIWGDRISGDEESSPDPYLVGKYIRELFLYENRLAMVAEDTVSFSRTNEIFSFFKETVQTKLDTDPINVRISHGSIKTKVTNLYHALAFPEQLILFSDTTQYSLEAAGVLTPENLRIKTASEYDCSKICKPIPLGDGGIFTVDKSNGASLREYLIAESGAKYSDDITGHIPTYIPTGVFKITGSTSENILLAISPTTPDTTYVYNYFYNTKTEKGQSAWSKWLFEECEILYTEIIGDVLYLVINRVDGVFLETMRLSPTLTDIVGTSRDFLVHLDHKVYNPYRIYDAFEDVTIFTYPYHYTGGSDVDGINVIDKDGNNLTVVGITTFDPINGSEVYVSGNYLNDTDIIIGCPYAFLYEFSTLYLRMDTSSGNKAIKDGRTQVRNIELSYVNSGYFEVLSTPLYRDQTRAVFTGITIGTPTAIVGDIPISSGLFRVPIQCQNTQALIKIYSNSYLPCKFLGATWEGYYTRRSSF